MVWPSEKNPGRKDPTKSRRSSATAYVNFLSYFSYITKLSFLKLTSIPFSDYHQIYCVTPQGKQPKIHLSGPSHCILSTYDS